MNKEDLLKNFLPNKNLQIIKTDNNVSFIADNDEEKPLIEDITQKSIRSIKKRKVVKVQSNIELKTTRKSRSNIKKHIDLYIKFLKLTNKNERTIHGYIKKYEILIDYFNYKNILSLNDIQKKDCKDLQLYLLNFPKNLNKYEELKNKNIFELIDRNDKILDKYERLDKRTVDNYITRYKTLFNYFIDNDYIYNNYFLTIKNLKPKIEHPLTNFQKMEDMREQFEVEEIELLLNNIKDIEIKNFIIIDIISGCRNNELVNLKIEDIISYNFNYLLDIKKSKTSNGIRKIPIFYDFKFIIDEQKKNKKNTDYLFFNDIIENRRDKIQKKVMYQIRKYIKNKNKVFHSFRKNFTQQLYKYEIEELYIKLLLGHSLKDNLSFNVYNLSKINNDTLIEQINKINFKELFLNVEYLKRKNDKKSENKKSIPQDSEIFF
jgi:integrase